MILLNIKTTGAIPVNKAHFGMGRVDQAILMDDVSCTGREATLQNCSKAPDEYIDCDHSEDAGVICSGKLTYAVHTLWYYYITQHRYMH